MTGATIVTESDLLARGYGPLSAKALASRVPSSTVDRCAWLLRLLSKRLPPGLPLHLYFIQVGETGPIKIGSAKDVKYRLRHLQCGNPDELRVLHVVRNAGGYEREAHRALVHLRIRGEWFRAESDLLALIAELRAEAAK